MWISIKQEYPPQAEPVLLNVKTDEGGYYVLGLWDDELHKFYNESQDNIKATHWCALPLPPSECLKKEKKKPNKYPINT